MDPGLIRRLRHGQAEERDRNLADLLIERGILSAEEVRDLRRDCDNGSFGEMLVRLGRISEAQRAALQREGGLREVLDTVGAAQIPPEVQEARGNTLRRFSKYILIRVLGSGGMGEVWKAWDNQLHRWVALKFLKEKDPDLAKRFLREAQLASSLSHPNITRVYEAGTISNRTYIAMEFVDGASLDGSKRERRRAAEIARDAARAIHYAHQQGVLHRDLKPGNLLESNEGRIFVADLGLARPMKPGGTLTIEGAVLGTPSFMAPEQAMGYPADARTDVYGLGATLYALVEGNPPFVGGDNLQIIHQVTAVTPRPLSLQDDLAVIVRKAMERERRDRYQTAAELADDLDRYLSGEPIVARPVGNFVRGLRRIRRHPVFALGILLLLIALPGGTYFGIRVLQEQRRRDRQAKADAELEQAWRQLIHLRELYARDENDPVELDRTLVKFEARIDAALAHYPEYPRALYFRGVALGYRGEHREAEAILTRILQSDPAYHDARAARALSRLAQIPRLPILAIQDESGFRVEFRPYSPPDPEHALLQTIAADFETLPPEHPERDYGKAILDFYSVEPRRARETFERILEREPYQRDARLYLATTLLLGDRFPEAETEANRVLQQGLRSAKVYQTRAFARASQGKLAEALEDLDQILESFPSLRRFRAAWLSLLGRLDEALCDYDLLVREFPREAEHRLNRSRLHLRLGHLPQAREDAEEACRRDEANLYAHFQRARTLLDPRQAVEACGRVLELDPNYVLAHALRAQHLTSLGDSAGAQADLREAVRLEPENRRWKFELALNHYLQSQFAETAELCTQIVKGDAGHIRAFYYRALSYENLRKTFLAFADYGKVIGLVEQAVEDGQAGADEFEMRAVAHGSLGHLAEAVADATEALTRNPNKLNLVDSRALWLVVLGRFPEAVRDYDLLVLQFPQNAQFRANRANARRRDGDRKGALEDAEEACRLDPDNAWAHHQRGCALDDARAAVEAFDRALALRTDLAEAHARRGERLAESGDPEEPVRGYRKAIQLQPTFLEWHYLLGRHFLSAKDFKSAEEEFSRILKIRPKEAAAFADRGKARFGLDDFAPALEDFKKAVSLDPKLEAELKERMEECRRRIAG